MMMMMIVLGYINGDDDDDDDGDHDNDDYNAGRVSVSGVAIGSAADWEKRGVV